MHRDLLDRAAEFHGHLGPWLALGLRAGRRAARVLSANPFRLQAVVHCPDSTPYTCFLDGIQFGSGCTLGKGNIRHVPGTRAWVEFRRLEAKGGRCMSGTGTRLTGRLRLELLPGVWTELHLQRARTRAEVERQGRVLYRRPFSRLFLEAGPR